MSELASEPLSSSELHRAAFGDRPDLTITAVPADPRQRWLAAVVLGGQGRYAAAATLLLDLISGADPVVAALAASTLASHRRQLGGHASARALDARALSRLASRSAGTDETEAMSDVLLGLAADAVGLGRIGEARRVLGRANGLDATGWRAAIRLCWVRTEIELGDGRADHALPHARDAVERADAAPSARHRVKSALILGATLAAAGDHAEARRILRPARVDAADLGLLPLVWPCAALLADLDPGAAEANRRQAGAALHCVLRRSDPLARRLAEASPWVPRLAAPTG